MQKFHYSFFFNFNPFNVTHEILRLGTRHSGLNLFDVSDGIVKNMFRHSLADGAKNMRHFNNGNHASE
jgi:hypothetical protein